MDTTTIVLLVVIAGGIAYVLTRPQEMPAGMTLGGDPVDAGSRERTAWANAISAVSMAAGSIAAPLLANRMTTTTAKQAALSGGKTASGPDAYGY